MMTPARIWVARRLHWLRCLLAPLVLLEVCGQHAALAQTAGANPQRSVEQSQGVPLGDLRFEHLTTDDGLSQNRVVGIMQDRRGFMWFSTGEGLNRFDGQSFVVYKNDPHDPGSLSDNGIGDVIEDQHGFLWVSAYPGLNKFDPRTERSTRYLHDPGNPNSFGGHAVSSMGVDRRGHLWLGTMDDGLDRFDPATETFTHYRNDSSGQYVGWVRSVIEDTEGEIWFVGDRGLFHVNQQTGDVTRAAPALSRLRAFDVFEDNSGNFWLLTTSPIVGLIKYERKTARFAQYPLDTGAIVLDSSRLLDDRGNGFWVPSTLGLYYFDRRAERITRHFQHGDTEPNSLSDNSVVSLYRDRSGLLWVGTTNGGLNTLDLRQERFTHYSHRASDPASLASAKVTAIHQDPDGVLWVGLFPRALDRVEPHTGEITHFRPGSGNSLSQGTELDTILRDTRGYLWLGGWAAGLDRYDERTGRFTHYSHDPADPQSLMTDNLICLYEDPEHQLWVGQFGGVSRLDPATGRFTNYRLGPDDSSSLAYSVAAIHRDRAGTLWFATWGGILSRFDRKTNTFVSYTPRHGDPHQLQGGSIGAIHEDDAGGLWLAAGLGLYHFDRRHETFTRYTELDGLPSNDLMGLLEDRAGRLWISSKKGISRFDPRTKTFKNYDVSDGLSSNDFWRSCAERGRNGELFFCGSGGITTFFPDDIRDNPFVPPVVITSLTISTGPVRIGAGSVLEKAVPYVDSLTLPHDNNVFSFEFAALSYANPQRNRYRYRLEGFDPRWNEVDSRHRLATYTNLDHGHYVFRVQGSNSDGVWNEQGVSLPIVITPPWWRTNAFRITGIALLLALMWAAYQVRIRQLQHAFDLTLEARVGERTRIARELHDTLLQSFQGLLLRFHTASYLLPDRPAEAKRKLEEAIARAGEAVTEGRNAVQGLRASIIEHNDLAIAIRAVGDELAAAASGQPPPAFAVAVEGYARDLHPIVRDEIYKIAAEALRNAFRHAQPTRVEVDIRYSDEQFRLRVRDDGGGIHPAVLARHEAEGHYGLPGMRERAAVIGGTLTVWSQVGAGTELELCLPASTVYAAAGKRSWWWRRPASKTPK